VSAWSTGEPQASSVMGVGCLLTMESLTSSITTTLLSRAGLYIARTYLLLHPPKCYEVD